MAGSVGLLAVPMGLGSCTQLSRPHWAPAPAAKQKSLPPHLVLGTCLGNRRSQEKPVGFLISLAMLQSATAPGGCGSLSVSGWNVKHATQQGWISLQPPLQ